MTASDHDRRRSLEQLCDRTFGLLLRLDARGHAAIPARARRRFMSIWRPFDAGEVRLDAGRVAFLLAFGAAVARVHEGGAYAGACECDRVA